MMSRAHPRRLVESVYGQARSWEANEVSVSSRVETTWLRLLEMLVRESMVLVALVVNSC